MYYIETERLKLVPLTHDLLQLYCTNRATLEQALNLTLSDMQVKPEYAVEIEDALLNFWLPKTAEHPGQYKWYTNWEIILKSENISIGGIGFAGYVDESGSVETGFMLDERFHGKGYAGEALRSMIEWALLESKVKAITARTYESNAAARKLLLAAGFELCGNDDGLLLYRKYR